MGLTELIRAIAENGFAIVGAAAFIFSYLMNERRRSKRADANNKARIKKEEEIEKARREETKQQNEIFKSLLESQSQQMMILIENTNKTHSIEEDVYQEEINKNIDVILKQLREATGGCRAMLVKYHNGMYDLNGNSAIKMSVTNEDVSIGIQPFQPAFQNQFRGLLTYWCSQIRDNGFCFISDIEILKAINENSMYEFLKGRNVVAWYGYAIRDNNKNAIGFVVVEYISEVCVLPISIEDCLKDKSSKISILLNLDKGGWKQ